MRFSIGDLVVEKKINHWYFSNYGYGGYTMTPYYTAQEYWDEYYDRLSTRKPLLGIVVDIAQSDPLHYFGSESEESQMTYKVLWLNIERDDYMMNRYFYGDELRLLSKINRKTDEAGGEK